MKIRVIKIYKHVVLIVSLALLLVSCRDNGCIYADDFGGVSVAVNSNPESVYGEYPNQSTDWVETGLRVTGGEVRIAISGGWSPWPVALDGVSQERLDMDLVSCLDRGQPDFDPSNQTRKNFGLCAKTVSNGVVSSDNCICYKGETYMGMPLQNNIGTAVCNSGSGNNPSACVCNVVDATPGTSTSSGTAVEGDCVVHFTLADKRKDMAPITSVEHQGHRCRFNKGMGLYLGLFGIGGNAQPKRVYHLFSQEGQCPIRRNSAGQCLQEIKDDRAPSGYRYIDRTKYIYTATGRFLKDDLAGNNCSSTNDTSDDIYHGRRELVKLKIHDTYYRDNYGQYNVEFLSGFYSEGEMGILEWIVNMIEEVLLGKVDLVSGEREGGILMFLYKAIVMNSDFTLVVQLFLALYIAFYGISSLMGIAEVNKKELMTKILQIGVIMMFTSANGWQMYYDIFVKFFKVGMDEVINRISIFANQLLTEGEDTTSVIRAAMLRSANPDSMGSKFAYVDGVIRMLFSSAITKKIWSLFFYSFFGFLYIFLIYCVIFYFLYTMSVVAFVYCILLTKMIIGLVLGPIFLVFMLFRQTNEYFKKWITFLAARSLEAVILFLLLFILVKMIDQKFNELLYYSACIIEWDLWLFKFKWLVAQSSSLRGYNLSKWFMEIAEVAIVIYVTKQIIMQIPKLAGSLISISGASNASGGGSYAAQGFNIAQSAMNDLFGAASSKAKYVGRKGASLGVRGMLKLGDKAGIAKALDKVGQYSPIRSPRSMVRDRMIDNAINRFAKQADMKGLTGKDRDQFIRSNIMNSQHQKNGKNNGLRGWADKNKATSALFNLNTDTIAKRLDKKLLQDPMRQFLNKRAEQYKNEKDPSKILLGDKLKAQLKKDALKWASENSSVNKMTQEGALKKLTEDSKVWFSKDKWGWRRSFFDDLANMSTGRASSKKRFGGSEESRDQYLSHLRSRQFNKLYKGDGNVTADKVKRKTDGSDTFTRKAHAKNKKLKDPSRYDPLNHGAKYDQAGQNYRSTRNALIGNDFQNRMSDIDEWSKEESGSARAQFGGKLYERQIKKKKEQEIEKLNRERNYFKDSLKKTMIRNYTEEMNSFNGDKTKEAELVARLQSLFEDVTKKVGEKSISDRSLNRDNIRDGLVNVKIDSFTINGKTYNELTLFEVRALIERCTSIEKTPEADKELMERIKEAQKEAETVERTINENMQRAQAEKLQIEIDATAKSRIEALEDSAIKTRLEKMLALQNEINAHYQNVRSGSLSVADKIRLKFELEQLLRNPEISGDKYAQIMELISQIDQSERGKNQHSAIDQGILAVDAHDSANYQAIEAQAHLALEQNNNEIIALYHEQADDRKEMLGSIQGHYDEIAATSEQFAQDVEALTDQAYQDEVNAIAQQVEVSQQDIDGFTEQQMAEVAMMDQELTGQIIATNLEIEFGKDLSEALALDAGSIIVEGADISIGGSGKDENQIDQALAGSVQMAINGHESKIKLSKNKKKFLEYEMQNLDHVINSKNSKPN